MLKMHNLSG